MVKAFTHSSVKPSASIAQNVEVPAVAETRIEEVNHVIDPTVTPVQTAPTVPEVETVDEAASNVEDPSAPVETQDQTPEADEQSHYEAPQETEQAEETAPAAEPLTDDAQRKAVEAAAVPNDLSVVPPVLAYDPTKSRGNYVLKNGNILRKCTFRLTPDNLVLLKVVAAQRNVPVQAVLNSLIQEGLKEGRCDLHTVGDFLQYGTK